MFFALAEDCPVFMIDAEQELNRLLTAVVRRHHVIVKPSPDRLKRLLPANAWRLYGDYLKQVYKKALNSSVSWAWHDDCQNCRAVEIADYYSMPTVLLVENRSSDGAWIELLVQVLRPRLRWALDGVEPAIDIRQVGGIGEIPKELVRISAIRAKIMPTGVDRLRLIALADSDAPFPGRWSEQAREVDQTARQAGALVHIFRKRSIENYVPNEALLDYALERRDRKSAVDYITSLSEVARDHYPMKRGLNGVDLKGTSGIYPADATLGLALGDFIVDLLANFKHLIRVKDLLRRDGNHELESLLDLIEENL